jgi:hypothetical protein
MHWLARIRLNSPDGRHLLQDIGLAFPLRCSHSKAKYAISRDGRDGLIFRISALVSRANCLSGALSNLLATEAR